jgi:hypothetical protein
VLRKGLSPFATTISTPIAAPVVAGIRLRAGKAGSGKAGSGKGAASMVTEAINTARAAGAAGELLVRGDSAYGNGAVVSACLNAGTRFSVVLTKNRPVTDTIAEDTWTPVRCPGAFTNPDTGELISDAEVAEVEFTAFTSTPNPVTARLIVRRVRDRNHQDALFPVWRHHPFFTKQHRIYRPSRHYPPRPRSHRDHVLRPHRRSAGTPNLRALRHELGLGALRRHRHNLLRAAATLSGRASARGATLRRQLVNVSARLVKPRRRPVLGLPAHWPHAQPWLRLRNNTFHATYAPPAPRDPARSAPQTRSHRRSWTDQRINHAQHQASRSPTLATTRNDQC